MSDKNFTLIIQSPNSYSSKISGKCTRTNRSANWQYLALIAPLSLVTSTFEWLSSRFMHPSHLLFNRGKVLGYTSYRWDDHKPFMMALHNWSSNWQYFASIATLRLVMITFKWFTSRFMHPSYLLFVWGKVLRYTSVRWDDHKPCMMALRKRLSRTTSSLL